MPVAAFVRQLVAGPAYHFSIIRTWAPRLGAPRCAMWNVFITTTQGREKWGAGPIRGLQCWETGQWAAWKPSGMKLSSAGLWHWDGERWSAIIITRIVLPDPSRIICIKREMLLRSRVIIMAITMQMWAPGTIVKWFKLTSTQREYKYEDVLTQSIITWVSDKCSVLARSFLSWPTTYWLFSKACSSLRSCEGEKAVRIRLGFLKGSRNSGRPGWPEAEYTVS